MRTELLQTFIELNHLRQSQVADFLGISRGHMSNVMKGKDPLGSNQISKLVNNDRGWDVTPLLEEYNDIFDNNQRNDCGHIEEVIEALRESQKLQAKSQEQIDRLLGIIEKLTNKSQ